MRNPTIAVLAGLVSLAMPLTAQSQSNMRVMQAMTSGGKYVPPTCPIPGGNFRTSDAGVSLKIATEGGFSSATDGRTTVDNKKFVDLVTRANKVSADAIAANPQSAAAWYYLGRSALLLGDLKGADSALTKLVELSPGCAEEVKGLRQKAWTVLVNPGVQFLNKKQFDSALVLLRDANQIARYYPQGYYNLGATFANLTPPQLDSAIFYFKLAEDMSAKDKSSEATYKGAIDVLGQLYQTAGDNANAVIYLKKYLALDPTNEQAKRSLSVALRATGNTAEAVAIEDQLMSSGKLSNSELANVAVRLFNDKNYAGAADAFKKILASDPTNHDALYNLANAYLALGDGKSLIETSQKLLETDPLNPNNLKLLANGWKFEKNQDKQIEVVVQLQAMTYGVSVDRFTVRADGAKLAGVILGSEGRTMADKVIAPTPSTLVFEFVNAQGAVVATQEVAVQALQPNAKQDLAIDVSGAGIVGWKYHKK